MTTNFGTAVAQEEERVVYLTVVRSLAPSLCMSGCPWARC